MANSSDWIAALESGAAVQAEAAPGWIEALAQRGSFRPGAPFAVRPDRPAPRQSEAEAREAELAAARAEGEAAGRAAAEAAQSEADENRRGLRLAFRALDEAAMNALAGELAETVIALCSAAIADWTPDEAALARRCREAAARIGEAPAALRLRLNPADIEALGEDTLSGIAPTPDPALERGALLIEGAEGTVSDGPEEWRRAIAAAVRG